jgi:mannosyltransferase OCH1-like enzyme
MIPKILHFIWFQGWDSLPANFQSNVDSVIKNNPGYQVMKWDGNSLRNAIATIGNDYAVKYDEFEYMHQKIDFGRYAVLYLNGGISVDIDAIAYKGFDQTPGIQTSSFIVSQNSTNQFVNNAIILVSQKNPLMLELLQQISGNCGKMEHKISCIMKSTGPQMFNDFVLQNKEQINILPNTYFEPCSGADKFCKLPEQVILNHKHAATWISPFWQNMNKCRHWCRHYSDSLMILVILGLTIFIAYKISTAKS